MSTQSNCAQCNKPLHKNGVWCGICGYIHVKCSGLARGKDWTTDFICMHCLPTDTQTPHMEAEQPESTNESLDENSQPADFWGKITAELAIMIKKLYLEVVHWKPKFVTL